jgi:pimeloyl-ACP methyl ester carboxylesterase
MLAAAAAAVLVASGLSLLPSTTGNAQTAPTAATAAASYRAAPIEWSRCKDKNLRHANARCGYLTVPLDPANPTGATIQLAVSRILHTKGPYRGAVFANPGGPGASGLQYSRLGGAIPHGVGKSYDWYGIDPRGVGASRPALSCNPGYGNGAHRPYQPKTQQILDYWLDKTQQYAAACGASAAKDLLPHMKTTDNVADFEALRVAIGQAQVTYYGFSYGTYIGQVWATLHPGSLKAMVLDGVVDSGRAWYYANLDQDYAFQKVYSKFFRWVGKYQRYYHLGRTGQQVDRTVAQLRKRLGRHPLHGVGAADVDDLLTSAGYINQAWPDVATVLAKLANAKDTRPIKQALRSPKGPQVDNEYAVYLATECTDAPWPTDWNQWASDNAIVDKDAPYIAWSNAWFNAPCRTWPAPSSSSAFSVNGSAYTGPVLLINETFDAATPYAGAKATRARFPTASLIEGVHGTTHAASLSGVSCVDDAIAKLLTSGRLPARKAGNRADKKCPGLQPPKLGQLDADRPSAVRVDARVRP